mmetsp:Transcript_12470/g.31923  ORF Transcript_12470/g.31923 Transcript_12470/m.31923 type:complete len:531 (-) Transcript_12470:394-1986(-)
MWVSLTLATAVAAMPPGKRTLALTIEGLGELSGVEVEAHPTVGFFGGIPYGKAPVDELRWQPPVPHGGWGGVLDASNYGTVCMQPPPRVPDPFIPPLPMTEDCLDINVFAPVAALGKDEKLPVMLWLHGGAYKTGSGNIMMAPFVDNSGGRVIVVTANYRLGLFGFLASKELQEQSTDGSTGNYGIQDQRLAMQWIKQHISAFGGDGDAVTIFGSSAGGNAVINHLAAPASQGLFRAAIIQSGAYSNGSIPLATATESYDGLLERVRCGDVECLRGVPAETLVEMDDDDDLDALVWEPVVDGVAVVKAPVELIDEGDYNTEVPVIIGSTRDEFAAYLLSEELAPTAKDLCNWLGFLRDIVYDEFVKSLAPNWSDEDRKELDNLYKESSGYPYPADLGPKCINKWWQTARIGTDTVPGLGPCSVAWLAKMLARHGTKVNAYMFGQPTNCDKRKDAAMCAYQAEAQPGVLPSGAYTVGHSIETSYISIQSWFPDGEQMDLAVTVADYSTGPSLGRRARWPSGRCTIQPRTTC